MVDEVEATLAACVDHLAREDRFLLAALRERTSRDVIALHATLSPQELGGLLDVLALASNPAELAHLVTELKGLLPPPLCDEMLCRLEKRLRGHGRAAAAARIGLALHAAV